MVNTSRNINLSNYAKTSDDYYVTYMDTAKVDEIRKDLLDLANQYNDKITQLFKRISNIPYETKEWIGNQANKYFDILINNDKKEFLNFGYNLVSIATKLSNDIYLVTGNINKLNKLESEARYREQI